MLLNSIQKGGMRMGVFQKIFKVPYHWLVEQGNFNIIDNRDITQGRYNEILILLHLLELRQVGELKWWYSDEIEGCETGAYFPIPLL